MLTKELFTDKKQILLIDKKRIAYLLVFIAAFCVTEFGRYVYRPFIYENGIHDYGLADSIGNIGGIIVQIFFGLMIFNSNKKQGIRLIVFFAAGYILYEIVQPYLPKGVFDWKDIIGTIIGAGIAFLIFHLVQNSGKKKR